MSSSGSLSINAITCFYRHPWYDITSGQIEIRRWNPQKYLMRVVDEGPGAVPETVGQVEDSCTSTADSILTGLHSRAGRTRSGKPETAICEFIMRLDDAQRCTEFRNIFESANREWTLVPATRVSWGPLTVQGCSRFQCTHDGHPLSSSDPLPSASIVRLTPYCSNSVSGESTVRLTDS